MKKVLLCSIFVLLALCAIGGYALLDSMFPVAAPLRCPVESDISAITLMQNSDPSTAIKLSNAGDVLQILRNTAPTRIWSIQDYPSVTPYYTIEIKLSERTRRYFVYQDGSRVYIESPYEGVYTTDQKVLDYAADHFKH